jgi:endogenous inhibitor of DNA gyrase (YacG/DUF329 family)
MNKDFVVKCPQCKKAFKYYSSESRPFCCDKCKLIDMGHWLEESYVVEGKSNTIYIEDPEKLEKMLENEDYE